MNENVKRQLFLSLPYLLFFWLADKLSQAWTLSYGADLSVKILYLKDGFLSAFSRPWPSFQLRDLLIGLASAALIRLLVYAKSKKAKKFRQGVEYGSARWGAYYQL